MNSKKKFAVVLAGSGVYDGSEIHESTLAMYAISKNGGEYQIFAPDIDQYHVINHITGEEMSEKRNVLVESARIARGNIKNLKEFKFEEYDAILFPGGFGVAKNLCTFAFDGPNCSVNTDVKTAIKAMHLAKKPIGALCISPALIAKVLGNVKLSIGQDEETAKAISSLGATHINTKHGEIVIDKENKIVTTPCYMLDSSIADVGEGAENLVKAIMDL
ncbi:isoprenoid biosynthesis glyoxalase ElbB [Marinifilum sp. RC60d5]|uniref:isoprenoid biosynthesis glyoxalase ElbB n=1 Tax=Marinifilum sp. RC60d5 TaxID=3458414 RepID=UPI004035DE2A